MKKKSKENKKIQNENASSENAKKSDGAVNEEFPAVHIISREDTEKHFGETEAESKREGEEPAAMLPKADVHLQIDGRIWCDAKANAAHSGMEMSEYVGLALDQFKQSDANEE